MLWTLPRALSGEIISHRMHSSMTSWTYRTRLLCLKHSPVHNHVEYVIFSVLADANWNRTSRLSAGGNAFRPSFSGTWWSLIDSKGYTYSKTQRKKRYTYRKRMHLQEDPTTGYTYRWLCEIESEPDVGHVHCIVMYLTSIHFSLTLLTSVRWLFSRRTHLIIMF